jgi:hypothetical protein
VLLTGVTGQPNAIVRMPDGGFVVAGVAGTAWAVGTDSTGRILWKHVEPSDKGMHESSESEYHGAVLLKNGNILLCGEHSTRDHQAGAPLITVLDGKGRLVEQPALYPNGNGSMFTSTIYKCINWEGGIALVGGGSDAHNGFYWLVKLDSNGTLEWQSTGTDPLEGAVQGFDHSLVMVGADLTAIRLGTFDEHGGVVARRSIEGYTNDAYLLRPIGSQVTVKVVAYGSNGRNNIYSLDKNLQNVGAVAVVSAVTVDKGCG